MSGELGREIAHPASAAPAPVHHQSLIAISWPVMVMLAVGISGPLLDSWFLSRISDAAAAGVGATLPVFALLQTILNATGQGGASIAGQYLGACRPRLASATFALMLTLLAGGGVVLGIVVCLTSDWVVLALGLRGTIAKHASVFLMMVGPGFAPRALLSGLTSVLSARGLTRWNLWSSIAVVGVNLLLNVALVSGVWGLPQLGVPGVAIATVSSWTSVSLVLLLLVDRRLHFRPSWAILALGWRRVLGHLARIGIPSAVEPISYQLFQVALAAQLVRLGTLALTARVYAMNLANLPVLFSLGLALGAQILVSHLVGAADLATADRRLRSALAWGMGLGLAASLVVALTGRWMLGAFTRDAAIVALGSTLLWIDVPLQPAKAANMAITMSLRAAGDSRFPAVVGTALMWTVGLGAATGLAFGAEFGVVGLWLGMAIDEWVRAIANWRRWQSGAWRKHGVMPTESPSLAP